MIALAVLSSTHEVRRDSLLPSVFAKFSTRARDQGHKHCAFVMTQATADFISPPVVDETTWTGNPLFVNYMDPCVQKELIAQGFFGDIIGCKIIIDDYHLTDKYHFLISVVAYTDDLTFAEIKQYARESYHRA